MENQNQDQASEMSGVEMAEMRKKITAQYKEEIIFLKTQSTYEDLMATIEESKFRRYSAMARSSQLFAQMEASGEANAEARADFEAAKKEAEDNVQPTEEGGPMVKKRPLAKAQ